jgi:hypothetical protein
MVVLEVMGGFLVCVCGVGVGLLRMVAGTQHNIES